MGYTPLYVKKPEKGLVQNRQEFILPDDAYPVLENAFVWREQIRRRQGLQTLGRLRRVFTAVSLGNSGASPWTFNIYSTVVPPIVPEPNATIEKGSVQITIGATVLIDQGDGTLATSPVSGITGVINYETGNVTITGAGAGVASTINFNYFPGLPVMGLRTRELNGINVEQLVAFDTVYAYIFISGWQEFIPGKTWTGNDSDFFWTTNYWVGDGNQKIFWVTNFNQSPGDPIRYTNGAQWVNFAPQLDASGNLLNQTLALLPFRNRLVAFNTWEGPNLAGSANFSNRIRWAAIGNPFTTVSPIVSVVNPVAWRDDRSGPGAGKGGFLDIPTSEAIVAVGFVRDNLVIYCERSTWQLRYTGRSIAPFQIEKVNSELGAESTFSSVQFDTSLVGIGDKGIVECDSYKSEKIDIKIPDLVFEFKNANDGTKRVHGIRDIQQRLAYWTYVYNPVDSTTGRYPNRRLIYNYENDSWAIFIDSLTTLGTFQAEVARRWQDSEFPWSQADFPWLNVPSQFPALVGGNQQGYVMYLSSNLQPKVSNDPTLFITGILGRAAIAQATRITSPFHNLETEQVIQIVNIPATDTFASLNNGIFGVKVIDDNNFDLYLYSSSSGNFTTPKLNIGGPYIGAGEIKVRDGFSIISKKFNYLDQGQNIQLGYVDVLMPTTSSGSLSLNIYLDYNESTPVNILPQNIEISTITPDDFFNSTLLTSQSSGIESFKTWQRVFCPTRGNFVTLEWTLSNLQKTTVAQESEVQIDAQIVWMRPAGTNLINN